MVRADVKAFKNIKNIKNIKNLFINFKYFINLRLLKISEL